MSSFFSGFMVQYKTVSACREIICMEYKSSLQNWDLFFSIKMEGKNQSKVCVGYDYIAGMTDGYAIVKRKEIWETKAWKGHEICVIQKI